MRQRRRTLLPLLLLPPAAPHRRPGRESLVAVQTDIGALWRYDLETGEPTRIDTGNAVLTFGDGLVVKGRTLVVVRNMPHRLTYLRLDRHATTAEFVTEVATDPARFLTTADVFDGHLLLGRQPVRRGAGDPGLRGGRAALPSLTSSPGPVSPVGAARVIPAAGPAGGTVPP